MNATNPTSDPRPRDVRRRFDLAADRFHEADFVHRVTRDALLERMYPMTTTAATVIDLGCAAGAAIPLLEKRFRHARVVAVDFSAGMLRIVRSRKALLSKRRAVQADARALPFADASIDVVFSNLMLPWIDNLDRVFAEIARVLRKDGLFAFSTLGPDSLIEIREAWHAIDDGEHVNRFPDMHDVGDALLRARLRDPVLDVDRLSVSYSGVAALYRDLTAAGARNSLRGRQRGLMGKERFERFGSTFCTGGEGHPLTLELVYGHCWGGEDNSRSGDIAIDAGKIPVRRQ